MSNLNLFATVLVTISFALGASVGVIFGPWALLLAVVLAFVGTCAVFKLCGEGEVKGGSE